ncbi:HAAS signaling domain-containing protein [Cytobacillus dafuensis]|uniref:DUF1700 domain-containing protein n=1 Tax=Cytobacillus dafuensis TaxID=1742359 RepID=A0A5B8ZCW5_CYTDA|nr:permease prefix domain 1-containing protein [Cytobacillus dafuensis]QED49366.1 hypothetical protein FSZ17_20030 [Cytobacillus dafuensis]
MIKAKKQYLDEITRLLRNHPDHENIIAELSMHIDEMMADLEEKEVSEFEAIPIIMSQLGTPRQIAKEFKGVSTRTPGIVQNAFILINSLFFFAGLFLVLGSQVWNIAFLQTIWQVLSQLNWLILGCYTGFWAWMGYEYGKEFGVRGKVFLAGTIKIAIIPNLLLMIFTLFGTLPSEWFHSILSSSFILGCLLATALFFPISKMGYYIGKHKAF